MEKIEVMALRSKPGRTSPQEMVRESRRIAREAEKRAERIYEWFAIASGVAGIAMLYAIALALGGTWM